MLIKATNDGAANNAGFAVGYNLARNNAVPAADLLAPQQSSPITPEISQIYTASKVPLDGAQLDNLTAAYKTYDNVTQASLNALSDILRGHDQLIKQLASY